MSHQSKKFTSPRMIVRGGELLETQRAKTLATARSLSGCRSGLLFGRNNVHNAAVALDSELDGTSRQCE